MSRIKETKAGAYRQGLNATRLGYPSEVDDMINFSFSEVFKCGKWISSWTTSTQSLQPLVENSAWNQKLTIPDKSTDAHFEKWCLVLREQGLFWDQTV